ncbi:MAG: PQQ-dependent sugar dehydrogenase [Actinobacteria bacterium]|nr:PQQ-dependent sugar dehydrogenase [Actinomycetota bacterium]
MICFILLPSCSPLQKKPQIKQDEKKVSEANQVENKSPDAENGEEKGNENIAGGAEKIGASGQNGDIISLDLELIGKLEEKFILKDAFNGIEFEKPVDLQNPNDGSKRLFIVEQKGKIFTISANNPSKKELFLDISDRVSSGGEKGLLGLAFDPEFKDNGLIYVNYTNVESTVISRFKTSLAGILADAESEDIILSIPQPFSNHNGGQIAFGPDDGYLYISTGDGGGSGDPGGNGQDLKSLLGKILRIDVKNKEGGLNYAIPSGNIFKANKQDYREEIYAYGLRNPWRFSFDLRTGSLWAADVGQNKVEEINIIENGKNYGWNIMEGSYCFNPPSGCNPEGLELPVYEYEHPLGKSITGGYVYYGDIEALRGLYIYADFVTGYIWGLAYAEGGSIINFTLLKSGLNISTFGVDEENELYIAAFDGKIYKIFLP